MNNSKISTRYAKALLQSATEQKILEPVRKDMEALLQIVSAVPELIQLLESPVVEQLKKKEIINNIFSDTFNPLTLSFVRMTIDNKREEHLPAMARMFIHQYKEEKGIKMAVLTTTVTLDKQARSRIIHIIQDTFNTKIELSEKIDQDLIGGFILRVEDKQLDASVIGQLKRIRKELLETPLKKTV